MRKIADIFGVTVLYLFSSLVLTVYSLDQGMTLETKLFSYTWFIIVINIFVGHLWHYHVFVTPDVNLVVTAGVVFVSGSVYFTLRYGYPVYLMQEVHFIFYFGLGIAGLLRVGFQLVERYLPHFWTSLRRPPR